MQNSFKSTLTATAFALLVTLPFSAHAADDQGNNTTAAKGSVKEILTDIRSNPRGADGEIIKSSKLLPFGNQDNNLADCIVCSGGYCVNVC